MGVPNFVRINPPFSYNWEDLTIDPYGPDMNDDEGETRLRRQLIILLGIPRCTRFSAILIKFE